MGAWGTGIFSNDDASDIRDDFRDMIAYGRTTQEAIDEIVQEYDLQEIKAETSDGWLALACMAWNYGRLTEDLKNKALFIIQKGIGEELWLDAAENDKKKRRKALLAAAEKLTSTQPEEKTPHKRKLYSLHWQPGEIYTFSTDNENQHALLVISSSIYRPSKYAGESDCPFCPSDVVLLKWDGKDETLPQHDAKEITVYASDWDITLILSKRQLHYDCVRIGCNVYDVQAKTSTIYNYHDCVSMEIINKINDFITLNKNHALCDIILSQPEWLIKHINSLRENNLLKEITFTI